MRKTNIAQLLLFAVYPRRCPVCHDIVHPKGGLACPGCARKVQPVREPRCKKCGKSLDKEELEYCVDCSRHSHTFDEGIGILPYSALMRESLMKCKYGGRKEYLDFYGEQMVRYGGKHLLRWKPQAIVPIPMHKAQLRMRGFNQSACLSQVLGESFGIPVYGHMLEKTKKTKPQKGLGENQRRTNLRGAFSIGKEFFPFQRVLLVDDVYTTGGTVDEAARCLKRAGVGKAYVMALCIGRGF